MKKLIFIFFIIICNSYIIFSQNHPDKVDSSKQTKKELNKNLVFGEIGGNGIGVSINYERFIYDELSLRVGFGTAVLSGLFIPIMINYSYENKFEFGIGVVPFGYSGSEGRDIFASQESGLLITTSIGFKRIHKNFLFKFLITPLYNPSGPKFKLYGGISVGFTF